MIGVTEVFPNFALDGVNYDNKIVRVSNNDVEFALKATWSVYYFYPKDFTFICPTEIAEMDRLVDEGVNLMGFSGDNEHCKLNWKKTNPLIKDIRHPLVADTGLGLSRRLGVVDENAGVCLRATYIVSPMNVIKSVSVNELDTGRNVDEVIRTLHALQADGLTPCAWRAGDDFVG
tara:strand:+ start:1791 stop:2315 length:525 start_codon:yes stop_codon:yes gene_type:complete